MSNELEPKLSQSQCDLKAYDLWCESGFPRSEYQRFREAVENWNAKGAIPSELQQYVKAAFSLQLNPQECDLKADDLWIKAGRRNGEYQRFREAIKNWNAKGAVSSELQHYIDPILSCRLTDRQFDRKAYDLWSEAGRPKGEYPKYRKAVFDSFSVFSRLTSIELNEVLMLTLFFITFL